MTRKEKGIVQYPLPLVFVTASSDEMLYHILLMSEELLRLGQGKFQHSTYIVNVSTFIDDFTKMGKKNMVSGVPKIIHLQMIIKQHIGR